MAVDMSNGFVDHLQGLMEWVDNDAQQLSKEDVLDCIKVKVLVLAKKFIAYPHCNNFSLMPQPKT